MAQAPEGEAPEPATEGEASEPATDDPPDRRGADSITDYRAVAFLFILFFLAIGLMYLIRH